MVTRSDVRADVVVLTAIDLEYAAVRGHLTGLHTYADAGGTRYEIGELPGGRGTVALGQTGPGNLAASALTGRAVAWFQPKALVFVGIAGGLTGEVSLGDVVVATRVHFYHGGRDQADGFVQRHRSFEPSHGLEQDAHAVHRGGTWARLLPGDHVTAPEVHFKPIVSGEVVLDSLDGPTARQIAASYSDAVAVEMESAGVADAARRNDFHRTITVRGISDRADGTKRGTDKGGWQHRAAAHAAAFAIALAGRIVDGPRVTRPVGVSPYRGLDAFGEDDADVYFGRAELTGALAAKVTRHRLVAVVGRSGSGKSSLLRAGLVPTMRGREWATAVFTPRPGVSAAGTLAAGVLPLLRPGQGYAEVLAHRTPVAQAIANGRLAEVLGDVLRTTGAHRLLVCVDQFEELVVWREDEARELVALLTRVATGPVPVSVALTVRAETLDVAVDRLGLLPSIFLVTPMTTEQLREAVEAPARATGVTFEHGLQTRILDAARDAPAALTLTQFALTRLWDEQDNGRMTHHAYDAFGGVAGALASYAEQVWEEHLDEAQRVQARRLLVQLVRPDGDGVVRRTARGSELAPELLSLATHLATTRLLVTGTDETGETTVDLAHAALATHWQRLRDWLAEERDFRAWQEDLRESIRRAEPLRGVRLTSALRWLRIHPDGVPAPERVFIRTSRRRHRLRRAAWRGLLVIIVGLLLVASTFAVVLNERGDQLAAQARQNSGGALVNLARARLSTNPDTAALLSVAAYRAHPEPATLANLAAEYQRYRDTDRMMDPGVGQILDMAMSADGRTVAVAGIRGTALLRLDGEQAEVIRRDGQNRQVALSQDGRMLAGVTDLGLIELWGPDGVTRFQADRASGRPSDMRFDSTGTRLVAIMSIGGLVMWDLGTGNTITVPSGAFDQVERTRNSGLFGRSPRVWFGPDDTSLLVASNSELTKWPLNGGPETQVLRLTDASQVLVTGDGRTAVTCADRTFAYWDIDAAEQVGEQPITDFPCPETMLETTADHTGGTVVVQSPRESVHHPRDAVLLVDRDGVSTRFVTPAPTVPPPTFASRLATTAEGVRLVSTIGTVVSVVDATAADSLPIDKSREPLISPDLRYTLNTSVWVDQLRLADTATGDEKAVMSNKPDLRPSTRAVPRQFTVDGNRLIMLGQGPGPLEIYDVPSLTAVGTVELPGEMRQARDRFPKRFNSFCVLDLPNPREVAVIHGGQAIRVDVGAGAVTDKFALWRTDEELERLADVVACRSRPGRAEVAFDVGRNIELWDLDRKQRTAVLRGSDVGTISSMWFTPDGRQLAVTGFDGSLEVWDVEKRRVKHPARTVIDGHLGVGLKAFPSADRVVLTSGGMLRVWDVDSNAAIADVETNNPFTAAVAPDGSSLMYWGHAGLSRMPLDPRQWADHLCRLVGRDLTDAERRDVPPGTPAGPVC